MGGVSARAGGDDSPRVGHAGGARGRWGDAAGASFFTTPCTWVGRRAEPSVVAIVGRSGSCCGCARAAAEAHQAELQQKQEQKLRQQQKRSEQDKEEKRKREQQQQEEEEEEAERGRGGEKRKKEEEEEEGGRGGGGGRAAQEEGPGLPHLSPQVPLSRATLRPKSRPRWRRAREAVKAQKTKCERLMPVSTEVRTVQYGMVLGMVRSSTLHDSTANSPSQPSETPFLASWLPLQGEGVQMKMVAGPCLPPTFWTPTSTSQGPRPEPAKRAQGGENIHSA